MILDKMLGLDTGGPTDAKERLYAEFGVTRNPFPPAGQPSGHPHLETAADAAFAQSVKSFLEDELSQVLVVEGAQGVGKTNLLTFYNDALQGYVAGRRIKQHIVLYYGDPERSFEKVINTLLLQLRGRFVKDLAAALAAADDNGRKQARKAIRNPDVFTALVTISRLEDAAEKNEAIRLCFEWISGQRLLKKHREVLDVTYRLDTVESKTQVLRDLMELGGMFSVVEGIFLLLDELEKQDVATSRTDVVRFLLAIRAMIDALPRRLFLAVALTPVAKNRYFSMVPAVESRVQRVLTIEAFTKWEEARPLYLFYTERAREAARSEFPELEQGLALLISEKTAESCFMRRFERAKRLGVDGLSPREFLDELHNVARTAIRDAGA